MIFSSSLNWYTKKTFCSEWHTPPIMIYCFGRFNISLINEYQTIASFPNITIADSWWLSSTSQLGVELLSMTRWIEKFEQIYLLNWGFHSIKTLWKFKCMSTSVNISHCEIKRMESWLVYKRFFKWSPSRESRIDARCWRFLDMGWEFLCDLLHS